MPNDAVELSVEDRVFQGWTSVEITDSLEALSPTFSLAYTRAQGGRGALSEARRPIALGARCEVRIGDELVITGFADEPSEEIQGDGRELSVSGRSRTADLIDCSALRRPTSWKKAKLDEIARDLCAPFSIDVSVSPRADLGPVFATWAIEPSESVFDCLSRAARARGLLLQSTATGDLEIATSGEYQSGTTLRSGEARILSARLSRSLTERYSEIRVRSQATDAALFGVDQAQAEAVATDVTVPRHRPLVVVSDSVETRAQLRARAEWEVSSRAGRGSRVSVTLQGWRDGDRLWRPNTLIRVVHGWLLVDAELLIVSVRYSLAADGRFSTLELCPQGAYRPEPYAPKRKPGSAWP